MKTNNNVYYDIIAPVIHYWMLCIHQYVSFFEDESTKFFFCARAGVRIREIYSLFQQNFTTRAVHQDTLWASRLSICKGTFFRQFDDVVQIIEGQFAGKPVGSVVEGLLRNYPDKLSEFDFQSKPMQQAANQFHRWIMSNDHDAKQVRAYLRNCEASLDKYISDETKGFRSAVLVDSGWQGTAQWLLSKTYPSLQFKGIYFGRIISSPRDNDFYHHVIGTVFEENNYTDASPSSAVVEFHHLIEHFLEGGGPSIEEIPRGYTSAVARRQIEQNIRSEADRNDLSFEEVYRYIADQNSEGCSLSSIQKAYCAALPKFRDLILYPTREEATSFLGYSRSADLGTKLCVPILRSPDTYRQETSAQRINQALWKQGQIALECGDVERADRQHRLLRSEFSRQKPFSAPSKEEPVVCVVTRTRNRPLLFRRAAASVAAQTFQDYAWIVVNDGGDVSEVKNVILNSEVDLTRVVLINCKESVGMEAASNLGVRACQSEFIVIHDDDDSWDPLFLQEAVSYLQSKIGSRYGGVTSKTVFVSEEIVGEDIKCHSISPYMDWVRNVQLTEMAKGNFFAPISFLYRRSVYDSIGGYEEDLPVLGDWMFNIEFLLRSDIAVIRNATAYYHHRNVGDADFLNGNSVIARSALHEEYNSIVRNRLLRKHYTNAALASALSSGYIASSIIDSIDKANAAKGSDCVIGASDNWLHHDLSLLDRCWLISIINRDLVLKFAKDIEHARNMYIDPGSTTEGILSILAETNLLFDCPNDFDEEEYLINNPDVNDALRAGEILSPYWHYVFHGWREGRRRCFRK